MTDVLLFIQIFFLVIAENIPSGNNVTADSSNYGTSEFPCFPAWQDIPDDAFSVPELESDISPVPVSSTKTQGFKNTIWILQLLIIVGMMIVFVSLQRKDDGIKHDGHFLR
jgi:hypothetical protein